MIKITVLALFIALQSISAEKDLSSRRLLQFGNPAAVQPGGGYPYYYPQQPQQTRCGHVCDFSYDNTCYNPQACWTQIQGNQQAPPATNNPPPAAPPANNPPQTPPQSNPGSPPGAPPQIPPIITNQPPANQPPVVGPPPVMIPPQGPGAGPGFMPGGPGMLGPPLLAPPLTEVTCTGTTPMGMPAIPGTATSCQNRQPCPPGPPAPGAPPCAGPMVYSNLAQNFKLYCSHPMGCAGSEIDMNFGPGQQVQAINQLLFSEPASGQGSTVNVRNNQGIGNVIEVSRLECSTTGSCGGLTINMWGASMNDVDCGNPMNCQGCIINLWAQQPSMACPNPNLPVAQLGPGCLIEQTPCFGY